MIGRATKDPLLPVEVVVVSGCWPIEDTGYGIAVAASLREYLKHFSRVHFIGPSPFDAEGCRPWLGENIEWIALPLVRGPKWLRFLRSLASRDPAITVRFGAAAGEFAVHWKRIRKDAHRRNHRLVVIYEDLPAACFLPRVRRDCAEVPQAVRSLNILVKGFAGLQSRGSLPRRLAWRIELSKIRRFERATLRSADLAWAITAQDAFEYRRRLGLTVDGVFGVRVDTDRYREVPPGDPHTVVHLGSSDLRKGAGLRGFVEHCWPLVRARAPRARLVLGGRGTEVFTEKSRAIQGLGFVDDDRHLLARGSIFVNPQRIGAGIKLKSVVAMSAARALVATETGIEGVEGVAGEHFFVADDWPKMARRIADLVARPELAAEIGRSARSLVQSVYTQESLSRQVGPLLADLTSLCGAVGDAETEAGGQDGRGRRGQETRAERWAG